MKKLVSMNAALAAICIATSVRAADLPPGQIDLGKFTPVEGAEFVEVNINSNLIAMVSNFTKKAEPEIAQMLAGLKSIRVNVLELTTENRDDITERVTQLRSQLDKGGWDRIVTVMKDSEDVGVYMKTKGANAVEGVVVTVLDGNQAVLVNIIGDIQPEKLATVGERFNIEPLKHLPGKSQVAKSK